MKTDEIEKLLAEATPGPWLMSDQTVYTLRATKWAGLDTFENAWQAQISQDGQHKTPLCEVKANARLIAMAPDLAAEVVRLRKALNHALARMNASAVEIEHAERIARAALEGRE